MVSSDVTSVIELSNDHETLSEAERVRPGDANLGLAKRKALVQPEDKVQWTDESDGGPAKPKKKRAKRKTKMHGVDSTEHDRHVDLAGIPDYLQERRRVFDANKKLHHEAALMLPPTIPTSPLARPAGRES